MSADIASCFQVPDYQHLWATRGNTISSLAGAKVYAPKWMGDVSKTTPRIWEWRSWNGLAAFLTRTPFNTCGINSNIMYNPEWLTQPHCLTCETVAVLTARAGNSSGSAHAWLVCSVEWSGVCLYALTAAGISVTLMVCEHIRKKKVSQLCRCLLRTGTVQWLVHKTPCTQTYHTVLCCDCSCLLNFLKTISV